MLEHTADLRVRIFGRTLRGLFQNAVGAITDILTDAKKVRKIAARKIDVTSPNREQLLVGLLREILYHFDVHRFLVRRLEFLRLDDTILAAKAWGERISRERHILKTEIKAVTYHGLKVERRGKRWVAEVIFDV